jgi:MmeI, DNA-methyltransferase domain/MmeI, N-terminal domain/MmeI, helicase spacer domain
MRSGEEIQGDLREFVARWRDYSSSERSEAQTFLNELIHCYGADRKAVGARFEDAHTATGIMDLYWPEVCIVEMKAPHRAAKLAEHRKQAFGYWHSSDDAALNRAAATYVALCAFQRFIIWEPGRFPSAPRADFTLDELPENYEKLLFLTGTDQEPLFGDSYKELTTEAAKAVVELYQALLLRKAQAQATLREFLLQIVWCLFAEDIGMLEGHPLQRIVKDLVHHPKRSSYTDLGALFDVLNDPTDYGRNGVLHGTRYVNGSLFSHAAKVHLDPSELAVLVEAAHSSWGKVNPAIFGSLMEGCLGRDRRWELGAHYTHEVDIMKIVRPSIMQPWRNRIHMTKTVADVQRVLEELCAFRVLDPACGCGNFLYVAYRELRCLEHKLKERLIRVAQQTGMQAPDPLGLPYYRLGNLRGIDIEPTAVLIARLTLWMGQRQMIDRFGPAEPALPLVDLFGIQVGDALEMPWPVVDCIIGNPPFLGSQHVRATRGDAYTNWLKTVFKVGVKDYCVYWFRKAHDHLTADQRAGLVGTNSISQNRARSASLEYITANGGVITDAVSSQDWPGEASVHVSLVNWIKAPTSEPMTFVLDGELVDGITPELRTPGHSTGVVANLKANKGRCFQGPIPVETASSSPPTRRASCWQSARSTIEQLSAHISPAMTSSKILDKKGGGGSSTLRSCRLRQRCVIALLSRSSASASSLAGTATGTRDSVKRGGCSVVRGSRCGRR